VQIRVAGAANAGVSGIDSVLGQIARALGILGEQHVPVVVEVADNGYAHALSVEFLDNAGNRSGGLIVINRDAHQFRSGARQGSALLHRRSNVGCVGIRHRLHHYRCIGPDAHTPDDGRNGLSTWSHCHEKLLFYHASAQFHCGWPDSQRDALPLFQTLHISDQSLQIIRG